MVHSDLVMWRCISTILLVASHAAIGCEDEGWYRPMPKVGRSTPEGCSCTSTDVDCFFTSGELRPTTDLGLAGRICTGAFPLAFSAVLVESYEGCNRVVVSTAWDYGAHWYAFDARTHQLVGAGQLSEGTLACPGGGRADRVTAGEDTPSCARTSCTIACINVEAGLPPECTK
jgi:hypothetical protein